jgi:hypothetical protein
MGNYMVRWFYTRGIMSSSIMSGGIEPSHQLYRYLYRYNSYLLYVLTRTYSHLQVFVLTFTCFCVLIRTYIGAHMHLYSSLFLNYKLEVKILGFFTNIGDGWALMGKTDTLLALADLGIGPENSVFREILQLFQDQGPML